MKNNSKRTDGFTLAELLIVVAIIAVLAVIAIPVFSARLENSREETDIANLRSAKAAAVAQYLGGTDLSGNTLTSTGISVYFDAISGELVSDKPSGYGRGTATGGGCEDFNMVVNPTTTKTQSTYTESTEASGKVISVYIDDAGTIALDWA